MTRRAHQVRVAGVCVAALLLAAAVARADDAASATDTQKLLDRIKQLEDKVNDLEGKSTQVVTQASITGKSLDFLGQVEMSGFVSTSYLYDFSRSSGTTPVAGRLYDDNNNSFTVNKFKLALEKPVSQDPTNWNAGFRTDLIVGQDAPATHSSGLFGGPGSTQDIDLEQAFVEINIPIGTGLKLSVGKTVTLMGVEVIEEVSNPNFSEGNQFIYVENFTQTGVQAAYQWTPIIDTEFVIFNGWDALPDNNSQKSFMGRLGIAPDANTDIGLIGFGGVEQAGDNGNWRDGAEIVVNRNKLFTDKLNAWLQLDYGHEENAPQADLSGATPAVEPNADWYAAGIWTTYDFTDKVELAIRVDYLKDQKGVRTPFTTDGNAANPAPVTTAGEFSEAPKQLMSLTGTLNYKPFGNLQVRPELRYDRAEDKYAFDNKRDQITAAVSVAYLF